MILGRSPRTAYSLSTADIEVGPTSNSTILWIQSVYTDNCEDTSWTIHITVAGTLSACMIKRPPPTDGICFCFETRSTFSPNVDWGEEGLWRHCSFRFIYHQPYSNALRENSQTTKPQAFKTTFFPLLALLLAVTRTGPEQTISLILFTLRFLTPLHSTRSIRS